MKKLHNWHIAYTSLLYRIGLTTPLLHTIFAVPLSISIGISLVSLCMGFIPTALAYGIGVMCSCIAILIGIRLTFRLLHTKTSLLSTLFFMNCKVLGFALFFVLCYAMLKMSILILLVGFTTPLCIVLLHVCKLYICTRTIKEV
ncbi:MAG: hypothetical protein K2M30_02645 [Desulfovibrionaceae bacterium]|nr:hypothetical protein [Desulfovibrionaceae bacterium]